MTDGRDPSQGWNVHLSVSDREGRDLLAVAAENAGERGASLINSPGSDLKELVLFSREDDQERAREAAIGLYQRLRRVAGLNAGPPRVIALARPSGGRGCEHRLYVRLMREANRVLRSESHHEWVVVLAQTACEVYVRDILDRRSEKLDDAAVEKPEWNPGSNLDNDAVRRIFKRLTGYTPEQAAWWPDYQAHAQRRHRIVHAGARVTRTDAESSIKAAEAMIAFLHWPGMGTDSRASH